MVQDSAETTLNKQDATTVTANIKLVIHTYQLQQKGVTITI